MIENRLRDDELRSRVIFELQERVWWLDYLDDSNYRQIYALKVLMNEDEDFEEDENVVATYDAAFELYVNRRSNSVVTYW